MVNFYNFIFINNASIGILSLQKVNLNTELGNKYKLNYYLSDFSESNTINVKMILQTSYPKLSKIKLF